MFLGLLLQFPFVVSFYSFHLWFLFIVSILWFLFTASIYGFLLQFQFVVGVNALFLPVVSRPCFPSMIS